MFGEPNLHSGVLCERSFHAAVNASQEANELLRAMARLALNFKAIADRGCGRITQSQVAVWTMTTLVRPRLGFTNLCGLWLAKKKLSPSPRSHVWSSTVRLSRPTSTSPASFPECW